MTGSTLNLLQGPRRVALAFASIQIADRLANEWGECVWTDRGGYRRAVIHEQNVHRTETAIRHGIMSATDFRALTR